MMVNQRGEPLNVFWLDQHACCERRFKNGTGAGIKLGQ
jgi:hypothetical protein